MTKFNEPIIESKKALDLGQSMEYRKRKKRRGYVQIIDMEEEEGKLKEKKDSRKKRKQANRESSLSIHSLEENIWWALTKTVIK